MLLDPWLGLPLFFGVMFLLFEAVFWLGTPVQNALAAGFSALRAAALEPALAAAPPLLTGLLLDGVYNGLSTVASFVPLIILFFLAMAIVEDTGYLSRAAFLIDALMARFGLDGRSFVMILMGFGCNVPALMGTRVMRSRGLRLLTMMVIPFSLCSARLQVFLFFIAALFPPRLAPLVLFSLYVMSIAAAMLTSLVFKRRFVNSDPFVLEIPPYRFPTLRQIVLRGWHEVRHFLRRATRFIVAGVVLVWLLTHFPVAAAPGGVDTWAGHLGRLAEPGAGAARHRSEAHHRADLRLRRQGDRDRLAGGDLRPRGRRAGERDRARRHLGAGLQLHAVHPDLHARACRPSRPCAARRRTPPSAWLRWPGRSRSPGW